MNPKVHIFPNLEALSQAVAEELVKVARAAVTDHGRFSLVLSGGITSRPLYRLLAGPYREHLPWSRIDLFWGDERYVPQDHPQSNYKMGRETLLDHVPIPADNVHAMPTDYPDPEDAARAYEGELRSSFPGGLQYDLVLLGLASDGHTASLFPGSRALDEQARWVVAVRAPAQPSRRLTLTLPALNQAAQVYFSVAGVAKAGALYRALAASPDPKTSPAAGVRPKYGRVVWWVDDAAASLLPSSMRSPLPAT